jgi:hypothetical protein
VPTRTRKPRDKAKVEVGVQVVERWILARLRNRRFFSLAELNQAIGELIADLNARPMQRLGVSRRDLFLELDRPALKPLPDEPDEYAEWRLRRVGLDYHVDIDGHYYSVPHRLIREQLDARITAHTIELFRNGERVAVHCAVPCAVGTRPSPSTCRVPIGATPRGRSRGSAAGGGDRPEHRQARRPDPGEPASSRSRTTAPASAFSGSPDNTIPSGWKRPAIAVSTSAPARMGRSNRSSSTARPPTAEARTARRAAPHPSQHPWLPLLP